MTLTLIIAIVATMFVAQAVIVLIMVGAIALPNPFLYLRMWGTPSDWSLNAADVVMPDGSKGWFIPHAQSRRVVLICHGRSRNKAWMLPLAARLAQYDNVLLFDFPGHGDNSFAPCTVGLKEADAVGGALDWLEAHGFGDIVVYGCSMGGAAATIHLGDNPRWSVNALVTDGTFANLHNILTGRAVRLGVPRPIRNMAMAATRKLAKFDPKDVRPGISIHDVKVPYMALHGDADWLIPSSESILLVENAGGPSRLQLYEGGHDEPSNPQMQQALLDFLATIARQPGVNESEPS